jgi:hypothetical protein
LPNKNKKKLKYEVRKKDPENGICDCKEKGIIDPNCFENIGVCPSLKIVAIFHGHRISTIKD